MTLPQSLLRHTRGVSSEDRFVDLVLSFHLFVGSEVQTEVSKLVFKAFIHQAISFALMEVFISFILVLYIVF